MTVSELDDILAILIEAEQIERYEAWQHTAYLCHIVANSSPKYTNAPFSVEDFMPIANPFKKHEEPAEVKPQTWQEMKATMQGFATMMNQGRG